MKEKAVKSKRPRKVMTYADAHNRAVSWYKKSSMFIFWAGVLTAFATVIGIIQMISGRLVVFNEVTYNWPTSGFSLGFSLEIFLAHVFIEYVPNLIVAEILIMILSLLLGGLFAFLGIFASKGRKVFLFVGGGLYLADFAAMFFVYKYIEPLDSWTNYAFSLATHVIVISAIVVAIIEYYRVLDIEKKFRGNKSANLNEEVESEVIAHE